jgi:hypothetical protein
MGNLNELGELRDPRRNWYRGALQVPWPAFAVPLLIRRSNGIAYLLGKLELLGERPGQARMLGDHAFELAMSGKGELQAHAEPVQRRIARTDQPHGRQDRSEAAQVMTVLAGLERDVVAKPRSTPSESAAISSASRAGRCPAPASTSSA